MARVARDGSGGALAWRRCGAATEMRQCAKGQGYGVSIVHFVKDVTHRDKPSGWSHPGGRDVGVQKGRPPLISRDHPFRFRSEDPLVGLAAHDEGDGDLGLSVLDDFRAAVPFVAVRISQGSGQATVGVFAAVSASIMVDDQSHRSSLLRRPPNALRALFIHHLIRRPSTGIVREVTCPD